MLSITSCSERVCANVCVGEWYNSVLPADRVPRGTLMTEAPAMPSAGTGEASAALRHISALEDVYR